MGSGCTTASATWQAKELGIHLLLHVIVVTFWYVFGTDLTFLNFLNFYFHLGLITTPHVLHDHMTYVYSFSYVLFFT